MWIPFAPAWSQAVFTYYYRRLESQECLRAAVYTPDKPSRLAPAASPAQIPTVTIDVVPAVETPAARAFGVIRTDAERIRVATDAECLLARELLNPAFVWALVLIQMGPENSPIRWFQAIGAHVVAKPKVSLVT